MGFFMSVSRESIFFQASGIIDQQYFLCIHEVKDTCIRDLKNNCVFRVTGNPVKKVR